MDFLDSLNVSADVLREKAPAIVAMDKIIRRDLIEITHDIKHAHDLKKEKIYYDLEGHFSIPNTTNTNAQYYIYSKIIEALKLKGFNVKLICEKNNRGKKYKLYIGWLREEDINERKRQEIIVKNSLI
jgi:hypothetical protein